ncbi:t-SNARE [Ascoidea rubescens DSM 1968]|uniref:t-SNARE n=1 Tax=Ascoidea rubescens DSM 1968 TaxID=1344418 RepID=A0A1D2VN39_9ASCO|nr:t-SNARE [Ascoidea rubescens DSM 1968]ODV62965.1 t-SNARE [Ascoidea rubescens DSM 1968]
MSYNYNNQNPFEADTSYEMGNFKNQGSDFFDDINRFKQSLSDYSDLINRIDSAQKSLLGEYDEEKEFNLKRQIDSLLTEINSKQNDLKSQLTKLMKSTGGDSIKKTQAEAVREEFLGLISRFSVNQSNHKTQNKQQVARQYKIIKPDATDLELNQAVQQYEDGNGEQLFTQALLNTNRKGEAKAALSEVQDRHLELLKIEKSMQELAQLFHDMEDLVIEQDENIQMIDNNIQKAQTDVEHGLAQADKAVDSARKARSKKRWCIFILILIILIIIGAVVGGVVGSQK